MTHRTHSHRMLSTILMSFAARWSSGCVIVRVAMGVAHNSPPPAVAVFPVVAFQAASPVAIRGVEATAAEIGKLQDRSSWSSDRF